MLLDDPLVSRVSGVIGPNTNTGFGNRFQPEQDARDTQTQVACASVHVEGDRESQLCFPPPGAWDPKLEWFKKRSDMNLFEVPSWNKDGWNSIAGWADLKHPHGFVIHDGGNSGAEQDCLDGPVVVSSRVRGSKAATMPIEGTCAELRQPRTTWRELEENLGVAAADPDNWCVVTVTANSGGRGGEPVSPRQALSTSPGVVVSATVFWWQDKQNIRPCNPKAAAAIADRFRHAQSVRRRNQPRNAKAALADGAQASHVGGTTDGGKTRASANQRRGLNVVVDEVRCKQRERGLGKEAATVPKPKKNTAVACHSPGTTSAAVTKMSVGFQACGRQSVSEGKEHERWITRPTTGRLVADRLHVQLLRCVAKVDALPLAGGEHAAGAALKAVLDAAPEGLCDGTSSGEDAAQVNAALDDLRVRVTAAGDAVVEAVKHRASAEINYDKADRRRLLSEIKSLTPDEVWARAVTFNAAAAAKARAVEAEATALKCFIGLARELAP